MGLTLNRDNEIIRNQLFQQFYQKMSKNLTQIQQVSEPIVYCVYGDTRSRKFVQSTYQNSTGALQYDGYSGYTFLGDSTE